MSIKAIIIDDEPYCCEALATLLEDIPDVEVIAVCHNAFDALAAIQKYSPGVVFLDVEMPLIWPGVLGSATFSVILSFNETVRTSLVQGPLNTVQTYIWSRYLQVGLTPAIYALMSLLIVLTLALIAGLAAANLRRGRRYRRTAPS